MPSEQISTPRYIRKFGMGAPRGYPPFVAEGSPALPFQSAGLLWLVLEDFVEGLAKDSGDAKGKLQSGRVLGGFDGDQGLARHAHFFGKGLLGQLTVLKAQLADIVANGHH